MVFSSLVFLYVFLPSLLVMYAISRNGTVRNWLLIVFSLFFYAWGEPVWVLLLVASSIVCWGFGSAIQRLQDKPGQAKLVLAAGIAVHLSALGVFKYYDFFATNSGVLLGFQPALLGATLPIGISFYTFQIISYLVDIYRRDIRHQSLSSVLLYVSFFPQLIAGPIVRCTEIEQQLTRRTVTIAGLSEGIGRFAIGLGKKVILANPAGEVAGTLLNGDPAQMPLLAAWLGITMYALQIYFDFSGYSDMAIGLGKMFGFTYPENFQYPYVSRSASDFWRRWNITLGRFFRDYVYIPLGGNRRRMVWNLAVVWFLTGLWHGASWNFIVWGLYFGLLIYIERAFLSRWLERLPAAISHMYLLVAMLVGWVWFYFTDLVKALDVLAVMFGIRFYAFISPQLHIVFMNEIVLLLVGIVGCTPAAAILLRKASERLPFLSGAVLRPLLHAALLAAATLLLVGSSYNPFLYFRF